MLPPQTRLNLHQPLGRPAEIPFSQVEVGQRVAPVRIKPSRDQNEVGSERFKPRQHGSLQRLAEHSPVIAGGERHVQDRAVLTLLRRSSGPGVALRCRQLEREPSTPSAFRDRPVETDVPDD